MPDPLDAVSPLDGRYSHLTAPFSAYASEGALIRTRLYVEIEYLLALADLPETPFSLEQSDKSLLRAIYDDFDTHDAQLVKTIETQGTERYPATNHDVKAVEYFIRERVPPELEFVYPWIHFGLTSEDVTNLAYRLLVKRAVTDELIPVLEELTAHLADSARQYRSTGMLARTHGQPATPTTYGKELAVYVSRLQRSMTHVETANDALAGKLAGASGTYAAHTVAFPSVDWTGFSRTFIESLGLTHVPLATQINPGDDLAVLFDSLRRTNQILIDLARDMWLYISMQYLGQHATETETGSSTMPHKVNPIDFENAEGNLSKANSDLAFLADSITTSRLQRDLTDSTVKRNIGTALAHVFIGYSKLHDGLTTVTPNEARMHADLDDHPEVLAEAVQTILRREGRADAYEIVKQLTRGHHLSLDDLHEAIDDLDIDPAITNELVSLTPDAYTGVASDLVDMLSNS